MDEKQHGGDNSLWIVLIESSHRSGWVALAKAERERAEQAVLAVRPLNEARRHARDLTPLLAELLAEQDWKARALDAVIVSRGPGSYTGLRVGLMSAKTLAYATGCALLAIDTFAAVAAQADADMIDVIADAQQDKIYVQRFVGRQSDELRIVPFADWLQTLPSAAKVGGPGLEIFASRLPAERLLANELWLPRPESLLRLGLERLWRGERDDPFVAEPLYLRPSSAEEKMRER